MVKKYLITINKSLLIGFALLMSACHSSSSLDHSQDIMAENLIIGPFGDDPNEGMHLAVLTHGNEPTLQDKGIIAKALSPSYAAFNPQQSTMFAVNGLDSSSISVFDWKANTERFNEVQHTEALSSVACHLSLSPDGTQLAVASYMSGDVHLFNHNNGKLKLADHFVNQGSGPHPYQPAPRMHYVNWDQQGRFLYALDLGTDEIKIFDSKSGKLTEKMTVKTSPGDGPRHLVFHPKKSFLYVLTELSNTVITYQKNTETGALTLVDRQAALPIPKMDENFSSAIKISKDGQFLYVAIRGSNMISVFSIDDNARLSFVESHSSLGNWPRDIELSADERFLFVANQKSDTVTTLKRDLITGKLSPSKLTLSIKAPAFITTFAPQN